MMRGVFQQEKLTNPYTTYCSGIYLPSLLIGPCYQKTLTTYHLPLTTYHLPLTTYHLPLTTYYFLAALDASTITI
ncbi:MAG: hypothetical protein CO070_07150 [Gallionellales bacterium CG_4_9_14_0_8_um_filter_55_61]|nr:MAG: hypothetical protein CO070_07150 [Gallionellales bacterium CG_4_9_14_0_8_um_filter_55_61]